VATGQNSLAGPLFTLFHAGAIGSLSDRQLLEQFANGQGDPAALAFTTLVDRHGPMVLRVCSALLRDPHDAQDAFQATFLVLIRKSRELWVHDSLGPWLHRVAKRTAERAQALARRRRDCERLAAEARTSLHQPPPHDARSSVLHEEIDRLPERLRILVVLCHLEGQSQELAAKTLSLPIGTVKSRLHRARGLLRGRLTGRGVAFSAGLLSATPATRAAGALYSLPLYEAMVHAATRAGFRRATQSGLVPERAIHLFQETIKTMFLTRIRTAAPLALLAGCLGLGAVGVFARQGPGQKDDVKPASARGQSASKTAGAAPSYIRRSRAMIIERLEQELKVAEGRLDLTIANVRTPNDPAVLRARKTVDSLLGLLERVDAVLVDAVDDFPTIFDFSKAPAGPSASADERPTGKAAEPKKPADPPAKSAYDAHSLAQAAERRDWAAAMHAKGYVSKAERDRYALEYKALESIIDADIARGADRVEWAERMHKKGYVSKSQYDQEILKHYDAIRARLQGQSQPVNDELLQNYERIKAALQQLRAHPGAQPAPESRESKPATEIPAPPAEKPAAPPAKPASDSPRAE
jgi:RNA polymerase sigma factor (sigma-70 family)